MNPRAQQSKPDADGVYFLFNMQPPRVLLIIAPESESAHFLANFRPGVQRIEKKQITPRELISQ
jgi:hypothetical protein